jgi:hypothetical protein
MTSLINVLSGFGAVFTANRFVVDEICLLMIGTALDSLNLSKSTRIIAVLIDFLIN